MKALIASCVLAGAGLAGASLAAPAHAQARGDEQQELLQVDDQRTLSFPKAIGRVEVSRENVIGVSAPTAQSIRIKALAVGDAVLTVFAQDGTVMGERNVRIGGAGFTGQAAGYRPGEKVVAVDVQFAAVSSSTLKALGFSFAKLAGDLQGAVISPSGVNSYSNDRTGLSIDASVPIQSAFNLFLSARNHGIGAVLSALSSNGLSQLLAQPTLLVRSGEQASFLAGGEFPVPVPQNSGGNGNTLSIEYKEFGVRLTVTPYVLSSDHIVLKLAPEVSELDYSNGVQLQGYVVPGIRRRSAETTVELGSGQSFVIAGLNYTNSAITKDKVPFLGDLPVLGAFFKRQQTQKERQELIIVATPRLVEPGTAPVALPSAPGNPDPSLGQMIVGNDGVEQSVKTFGVVRP
ncbi:type II and III secretion system protein family protein [Novosphingobium sp.]|uniref:type II and III secretion system protein family protein n=1 Tax=Novosphingobium sp. TaxID=1874826 RepID=UPI003D6CB1BA